MHTHTHTHPYIARHTHAGMFSKAADARAQRISEVKASIAYPGSYDTYAVGKILVEMMNYVLWKRFDIAPGKVHV